MPISLDKAALASLFVEAILYGLYTLLFSCTIYLLVYKRSSPRIHIGMLLATLLLFLLSTTHLITNFIRLLEAFHRSQLHPGAAVTVLSDHSAFKNLFKTSVLVAEVITGDLVLIYRCYVTWGGNIRVILLPLAILLGTMVTGSGVVWCLAAKNPSLNVFASHPLVDFLIATQVLVLVNNLLCTCLLAWKLWFMSRSMISHSQRATLRGVALIIAESGLLTAVTWIMFMVLYARRSVAEVIVLDALAPITGCAFCLIVSRVALGLDIESTHSTQTNTSPSLSLSLSQHNSHSHSMHDLSLPTLDGQGRGRPRRPLEINVSSRRSVRVEDVDAELGGVDVGADVLFKVKQALVGGVVL